MWLALTNGKVRLERDARRALDHELRHAEDVLTSMVFGRLAYLPPQLAWEIVVGAAEVLRGSRVPAPGAFSQELWPTLRAPDDVQQDRVEPDVVWTAPELALVVEVKWHAPHTAGQIRNEQWTVAAHHPDCHVVMVALGSVPRAVREQLARDCEVPSLLALSWAELRASIDRVVERQGVAAHHRLVLEDVLGILESRGLRKAQHLSDLHIERPRETAEGDMARWRVT